MWAECSVLSFIFASSELAASLVSLNPLDSSFSLQFLKKSKYTSDKTTSEMYP